DPPFTKIHGGPIQWGWINRPEDNQRGNANMFSGFLARRRRVILSVHMFALRDSTRFPTFHRTDVPDGF
ncbi:MAG: hypothetical protein VW453_13820, partial [Rhodospirillaceae bacterium]